jgi:O-antigen ligase
MQTQRNPILLAPRALLGSFVSFEASLVLYTFAGIYKGDPRFAWIPVDPTGLFFALSVVVGSFIIVRNPIHKKALPVVFAMVGLVTWFLVSLAWSPSRAWGPDKVFFMVTLALWAVIGGALIIAPDPERLRRLFTLLLLLALWAGVDSMLAYAETGGSVYRQVSVDGNEGGNHLSLGRICGLGALVALAGWLYSRDRVAGWLSLVLFLALCFVLAIGGGRGPLLATALALLIPLGLGVRLTTRKILYSRTLLSVLVLLLAVPAGLALYATVVHQRLATLDRLERLAEGNPRTDLYAKVDEFWSRAPLLGLGAGGWTVAIGLPNYRAHPHNLFAELAVEGGLVALGLFFALLATVLRPASFERMRRDPQALCAMMLFACTFLNAMVSGDLPGNRAMFMMLGVLALFAVRRVGPAMPAIERTAHSISSLAPSRR